MPNASGSRRSCCASTTAHSFHRLFVDPSRGPCSLKRRDFRGFCNSAAPMGLIFTMPSVAGITSLPRRMEVLENMATVTTGDANALSLAHSHLTTLLLNLALVAGCSGNARPPSWPLT